MMNSVAEFFSLAAFFAGERDLYVSAEIAHEDPFERRAIAESRRGDPGAYDYLVAKYGKRVLGIAVGLVRNRHDAEDLAQEAFVRGFQTIRRFRAEEAFGPWIYRIVTNLALDLLRSRKRRKEEPDEVLAEVAVAPEGRTEAMETARRVDRAIEALPEMQRVVARLYLVEEFSHAEIAHMTGLADGTVRSHLSLARARLQEALKDLEPR